MGIAIDLDLLEPVLHMDEGVPAGDVVHKQSPDGAAVVGTGDRPEVLLPGRVPDLQFDVFVAHFYGFCAEFDADCHVVGCAHFVLDELQHHAGFAHACVADYDEFE